MHLDRDDTVRLDTGTLAGSLAIVEHHDPGNTFRPARLTVSIGGGDHTRGGFRVSIFDVDPADVTFIRRGNVTLDETNAMLASLGMDPI